jgi:adenine phosphoribosyltransferase
MTQNNSQNAVLLPDKKYNSHNLKMIADAVRNIPNWPEPGVIFRDITPTLQDSKIFHLIIDILIERYQGKTIKAIAGLDARGFIFGPVLAYALNIGFIPIRKKGKLPYNKISTSYNLEYGDVNEIEMHVDAVAAGDKILVIDDLIATGGTMLAACELIEKLHGEIYECASVCDLTYLGGSKMLKAQYSVFSILAYS